MKINPDRATLAIVLFCAGVIALSFFRGGTGGSCALIPFAGTAATSAPLDLSTWQFSDLAGRDHTASEYAGRPYVLTFWATWCVNCRREMPTFTALHEELAPRGIPLLSVSLDEAPEARVAAYAEQAQLDFPVLTPMAEDRPRWLAAVRAVPTTLVVGPTGNILKRYNGAVDAEEVRQLVANF